MPAKQKRGTAQDWTRVVAQMSKNQYDLGIEAFLRVFRFMRTDQLHRALFAGDAWTSRRRRISRTGKGLPIFTLDFWRPVLPCRNTGRRCRLGATKALPQT